MKRIKKIKHRVAALLMSLVIALGCISPAFSVKVKAEAATVLNGTTTIADIIVTYMVGSGAGITNTTVLGNLYNAVGSSFGTLADFVDDGLLVVDQFGNYIDNGLGNAINAVDWSQVGLNVGNMFSATSEQVAAGLATGTTAGANLAASAGGLAGGTLIGTVAVATGAVAAGIGLGLLINHIRESIAKQISLGEKVDCSQIILDNSYPGGANFYYDKFYNLCPSDLVGVVDTSNSNRWYFYIVGKNNLNFRAYTVGNNKIINVSMNGNRKYSLGGGPVGISNNFVHGNPDTIASQINNGTYQKPAVYSPDVIGPSGNQTATYNSGEYNTPSLLPQIDPNSQGMQPIPQQQWLDFANSANQNTNTLPDPLADNAELFNDFISNYIDNIPEPSPDPLPDPNPDPETVPVTVPSLNPYPDTYPVADPESVPDNREQPEYTEKQSENETDITEGDPYTTPNLLNKFPFCIPRDIYRTFKKLDSGTRSAPHIQWRFHPNGMIDYTFDIDFAEWESIATLLRLLELIAFIISLAVATRNLILS